MSTDPRACANCHIMNEQYSAWLQSGHRHTATCVECHLPASGVAKWVAKADHGFRHSVAFTLQNFKEPIEITPRDREIVQDNCLRCHRDFVHAASASFGPRASELNCLHCHAVITGATRAPRSSSSGRAPPSSSPARASPAPRYLATSLSLAMKLSYDERPITAWNWDR
jgi:cytochrome c nitrite reductase small subunit